MALSNDIAIIRIEAEVARQRANKHAEEYFNSSNMLLCNLYAKLEQSCRWMIEECDSMDTCLRLIEEQGSE